MKTTQDQEFQKLIHLVNEGRINDAENQLWDLLDKDQARHFQMALLFYDHLNDLEDDVLEAEDFSREEVADGLVRVMKLYGYEDMVRTFII